MANSDTPQFRNDSVSDLGGLSVVTRQRGTLTAVALALFCIQLDFFALTLALPDMARSVAVTAQHDPASASSTTLLAFALLALAASAAVLLIRHMLVQRGLMKPLSMAGDQAAGTAGAGQAGHSTRVG